MPPGPTPGGKIGTVLATQSAPTIQVGEKSRQRRVFQFPVGTLISERPPDSSEQAQFGHSAPTLGV